MVRRDGGLEYISADKIISAMLLCGLLESCIVEIELALSVRSKATNNSDSYSLNSSGTLNT
jgi:hypothetical protein